MASPTTFPVLKFDDASTLLDESVFEWQREFSYCLKLYDASGTKKAEITANMQNTTLTALEFELLRDGGCGAFSFTLGEEYTEETIDYNWRVEFCFYNQPAPWFTGFITEVPQKGTDTKWEYRGYGYFRQLDFVRVNKTHTGLEVSGMASDILDVYVVPNTSIAKNAQKIEDTGYVTAATMKWERVTARTCFETLAQLAVDYEFGVDEEREFYFRRVDTNIIDRLWIGRHLTEFHPEEDQDNLCNKLQVRCGRLLDGTDYVLYRENAASQATYGLREDVVKAPEFFPIFSSTNIGESGTASASNAANQANLNDGDYTTLWDSGANQATSQWIKINLGSSYSRIAKVVLDSIHDNAKGYQAKGFKVEISSDDVSYTQVYSTIENSNWKPIITFKPIAARYVRITLTTTADVHWKVGEFEVYELDTQDVERWADYVLNDRKDIRKKATATIGGIDKIIGERPTIAPIKPRGKIGIYDEDGNHIDDYAIVACKYSLSEASFDLAMELGELKEDVGTQMRKTLQRLKEYEMSGVRNAANLAGGIGEKSNFISKTIITDSSIHTPYLEADSIRAVHYHELRNTYVFSDQDSLDENDTCPFEMDFEIISEMTAIVSVKLSFRIRKFRAYATGLPAGGGHTMDAGGGTTSGAKTHSHPGSTAGGGSHIHSLDIYTDDTSWVLEHSHVYSRADETLSVGNHTHGLNITSSGSHTHTCPVHQHDVKDHVHTLTFGIYEEDTSPTIHYHLDNGAGYGGASANYTTDQLDLDITALISGTGFKKVMFHSTTRARISAWVLCKVDLTA